MKILRYCGLGLALLLIAAGVALWFVARSQWFSEKIRTSIVAALEQATGGKAELDSFAFNPVTWQVGVKGLTVHGTEAPGKKPLVHLKSAMVGWKLISLMEKRVDVTSIDVDSPEVSITRDAKGNWNLPRAQKESKVSPFERFVDLHAGHVRVTNGSIQFDEETIPLAFEASEADVVLAADAGLSYSGTAKTSHISITRPFVSPVTPDLDAKVTLDAQGLSFYETSVKFGGSTLNAKGRMTGWDEPVLDATGEGDFRLADIKKPLGLPLEPTGRAHVKSTWKLSKSIVAGKGSLEATGLDWTISGIRITPLAGRANWQVGRHGAVIDTLEADLLGGSLKGNARVDDWRKFSIDGDIADLELAKLYSLKDNREFPWSGIASGHVAADGTFPDFGGASGEITVMRGSGDMPVAGGVVFQYDPKAARLTLGPSHFELAHNQAEFSGDPQTQMRVKLTSTDPAELLPGVRFFTGRELKLPLTLDDGPARLEGTVSQGDSFTGTLAAGKFTIQEAGRKATFDRLQANGQASASGVRLDSFRIEQGKASASGVLRLSLHSGEITDADTIAGNVQLTSIDLARALQEAGLEPSLPPEAKLAGTVNATAQLSGSVGTPSASGEVRLANGSLFGQPVDSLRLTVRASRTQLTVTSGEVASGPSTAQGDVTYTASNADWKSGRARFNLTSNVGALRRWFPSLPEGFEADARANAKGEIDVNAGVPTLVSLDGGANMPLITLNGRPLGDATVQATSTGNSVNAKLTARLLGSQIRGTAEWSISGNNPGLGQAQIAGLTLDNLRTLGLYGDPNRPLPARGSLDADVTFRGPIFRPDQWTAQTRVTRLELEPRETAGIDASRFALKNSGPLTGTFDSRGFTFETARLVGQGTDLSIGGSVGLKSRAPWNLQLRGSFNLTGLSVLEPDLEATGKSNIDAIVHGELYRPTINGSMQVSGATFRFRDVPNGLENVSGTVRFDTNRATIEKLTAQTGGGTLALTGFIGFSGPQLYYGLQAQAQRVRVRYPEEVSTTMDGSLSLSGTSAESLLKGDVVVRRLALQSQADFGGLLASTARSAQSSPTQNAFLRGMQLDVHVTTAADAELQTSLSRDLQPQADFSVRGTAARPVALGRATLSEGDITFAGSRYHVNRGEVNLYNAARIDPVLNFDLETTVRGVAVNINLSGPVDKLNTNYRSDPPLQPNEIISLLTVGRDTSQVNSQTTSPTTTSALQQSSGGGSLLGSAISSAVASPVSGRLQRLFGISRINIDPDLNSTSPQARLNVEEQISPNVRINFITNLSRTQSQIWRFQYDFSKDFSLIAIRDENGLFGVDVQFRQRFK